MGASISRERKFSILQQKLRLIEPLLLEESIGGEEAIWDEIQENFFIPVDEENYLDTFLFENVSQTLFRNNSTSGNIRSFVLFFLLLLSEKEKEMCISLNRMQIPLERWDIQLKNLISIGIILKLIFKHYLTRFGVEDFIDSVEHVQFFEFIEKTREKKSKIFDDEISRIKARIQNFYSNCFKDDEFNIQDYLFLYILYSLSSSTQNKNVKNNELSVFGQIFSKIPAFLIISEKCRENIDLNDSFLNLITFLQTLLIDILLILFFSNSKISNRSYCDLINVSPFIIGFQIFSLVSMDQNIHVYCDEEPENTQNVNYQLLQFLIKKTIAIDNNVINKINRSRSLLLLTSILFILPRMNTNIYYEWLNNISDPKFLPDFQKYSKMDSCVGSDSDNTLLEFSSFSFFEQIYHLTVFDDFLLTHNLSVLVIYALTHSNSHYISYCFSRADPEKLILSLLKALCSFSNTLLEISISKISLTLSILLRLTNDRDLCKVMHRTAVEHLPNWIKEESLRKIIYKECEDIKYGNINMDLLQNENSISIGNISLIVLLKVLFSNYKDQKDVYICALICSIITNISLNIENLHWYTAEKIVQYILFLNNQVYCLLNTFNGDLNDTEFCNRSYCALFILQALLHLIIQGLKNEYILSNIQLVYILIRMAFANKIEKFHFLVKDCFKKNKLNLKQRNIENFEMVFYEELTIKEFLQNILMFCDQSKFILDILAVDLMSFDEFNTDNQMFAIIKILKNSIKSRSLNYYNSIDEIELKRTTYTRISKFEFRYILKMLLHEISKNQLLELRI